MVYLNPTFSTHETLAILECGYQESSPGHFSTQKMVDHYVLHCITQGRGTYSVNNQIYHLEKGDCFLLIPNTPIVYQADLRDPWVYYWIGFEGVDLSGILSLCGLSEQHPVMHYNSIEKTAELIDPLTRADPGSLSQNYYAIGQFYCLCSLFIEKSVENHPVSRKEFYADQVVAYVRNNYPDDISVGDIARYIGLDRTYLYRIFREIKGMSIQAYILKFRLEKACYFLSYTNFPLAQISSFCGYSSSQHFSTLFKKSMGISPSEYRRKNRKRER